MNKKFPIRRTEDEVQMQKVMKAAIKEWMDERFAAFGKWTAMGVAIAAVTVLAWAIVVMNGVPWAK